MLVAGGATLTVRDRSGKTPRELALIAEDGELAAYLHSESIIYVLLALSYKEDLDFWDVEINSIR